MGGSVAVVSKVAVGLGLGAPLAQEVSVGVRVGVGEAPGGGAHVCGGSVGLGVSAPLAQVVSVDTDRRGDRSVAVPGSKVVGVPAEGHAVGLRLGAPLAVVKAVGEAVGGGPDVACGEAGVDRHPGTVGLRRPLAAATETGGGAKGSVHGGPLVLAQEAVGLRVGAPLAVVGEAEGGGSHVGGGVAWVDRHPEAVTHAVGRRVGEGRREQGGGDNLWTGVSGRSLLAHWWT